MHGDHAESLGSIGQAATRPESSVALLEIGLAAAKGRVVDLGGRIFQRGPRAAAIAPVARAPKAIGDYWQRMAVSAMPGASE